MTVTGAASGIGRATALRFAEEGASVVVADVADDAGDETVAMIADAGGQAVYQHSDVSSDEDVARLVTTARETFGGLDVAVTNAGILGHFMPAADIPVEEFDRIMAINVGGVFLGIKHQLPAIVDRGGGAIVNVASAAGYLGQPFAAAYTPSKHAVLGLTKAAALDHAQSGVRINSVCPGGVATNFAAHLDLSGTADAPDPHPIGRSADSAELAAAILWLASDEASFAVGANVPIDGGLKRPQARFVIMERPVPDLIEVAELPQRCARAGEAVVEAGQHVRTRAGEQRRSASVGPRHLAHLRRHAGDPDRGGDGRDHLGQR